MSTRGGISTGEAAGDGVYLDASALFAVFDADDSAHLVAAQTWQQLLAAGAPLHTCSYVLVELSALLQRRLGTGAVDALGTYVLPWVSVLWIDETLHAQAIAGLLAARRRDRSLVDCAGFAAMRRLGLRRVFTFDQHFAEQGFAVLPQQTSG
jgi:predicted nucleic acid-binding protein